MINDTSRPLYPRERTPVPILEEAGCVRGPVSTGMEKRKSLFEPRTVHPIASNYAGSRERKSLKNTDLKCWPEDAKD